MDSKSILIVDDDVHVLSSFERVLSEEGYNITHAINGSDAIKLLSQHKFDLILTDIIMEGIDGIEVYETAKKICPDISIILVSGYSYIDSVTKALEKNALDFLIKPCEEEVLLFRVKKAFQYLEDKKKFNEAINQNRKLNSIESITKKMELPLSKIMKSSAILKKDIKEDSSTLTESEEINKSSIELRELLLEIHDTLSANND